MGPNSLLGKGEFVMALGTGPLGIGRSIARIVVIVVCVAIGAVYVIVRLGDFEPRDAAAYWDAAMRLRHGEPLYVLLPDPDAAEIYRYAPWFAAAWIPLTYLPRDAVFFAWWMAMLGVAVYVCWRVAQLGPAAIALVGLVGGFLIWVAGVGNVHPLVLLMLLLTLEGRAGPIAIGLAASLKATPLAYALVYLGRREWRRFLVAVVTFAVLTAPVLAFGIAGYQVNPGRDPNPLLAISPVLWVAVVSGLSIATVVVAARWPSHAWWVASLVVMAAIPRFLPYSVSYLLVGVVPVLAAVRGWQRPRPGDAPPATAPAATAGGSAAARTD